MNPRNAKPQIIAMVKRGWLHPQCMQPGDMAQAMLVVAPLRPDEEFCVACGWSLLPDENGTFYERSSKRTTR